MLYATDVFGLKIFASPGARAVCPRCQMPVLAKTGAINAWHWAHVAGAECDSWSEGETDWHLNWKRHWPSNLVEITLNRDGIQHRADVMTPGHVVIELQHSPIDLYEMRQREAFYKNMIWVFDLSEARSNDRFFLYKQENYYTFHWLYPRKTFSQATTTAFWDLGDGWLFRPFRVHGIGGRGWGRVMRLTEFINRHGGTL